MQSRREMLRTLAVSAAAPWMNLSRGMAADESSPFPPLLTISGSPAERGRTYALRFRQEIEAFLDREIWEAFTNRPASRQEMLAYGEACQPEIRRYCPEVLEEIEGVARAIERPVAEVVLLHAHEELTHNPTLKPNGHCTGLGITKPYTADEKTFLCQTWDWMPSAFGRSRMLLWQRGNGPSVLAYGFPGLPIGAGVNSEGIAFVWNSANSPEGRIRTGIPSYTLLTHLLYQPTLDDIVAESRRARNAGLFTFMFANAQGRMVSIEGDGNRIVVEEVSGGAFARHCNLGTRAFTKTPPGLKTPIPDGRCRKIFDLATTTQHPIRIRDLQRFLADPKLGIDHGTLTIDLMIFDCQQKTATISRGQHYGVHWSTVGFA